MVVMLGVCMHLHSMLTAVPFTWKGGGKGHVPKNARVLHANIAGEKLQAVCHSLLQFVHSLTFDVFASSGNRNISSRGGASGTYTPVCWVTRKHALTTCRRRGARRAPEGEC